jgi:hypothetical protein
VEIAEPTAAAAKRRVGGRISWPVAAALGAGFLGVAPLAAGQGGYFPSAWGWLGLAACWVGLLALVLRENVVVSRLELVTVGGGVAVVGWTAASLLWTSSTTLTMLALERNMAYLAAICALVLVCRRQGALGLLVGAWAAIALVSLYALGTHLLPERLGVYQDQVQNGRLFQPVGYWNALGIFCAMGIMLAVGLIDRPGRLVLRVAAATSLPVLAATAYFTFSRGAWLAAGLALAVVVCLSPARLRYLTTVLVAAPVPALAVAYAASLGPLTALKASPAQIEGPGRKAAIVIAVAVVGTAAVVAAFALAQRRLRISPAVRRGYVGLLGTAGLIAIPAVIAVTGSPIATAHRLDRELTATPAVQTNLNDRLLSVSLSNRQYVWRVALSEYRAHPVVGGGAGTYATYWLEHRPEPQYVVNAHSLYLETLAELGVVGLAAFVLLLAPALVGAVRARANPLIPAALGAYVAFLLHAAVDWDWQVPAVTVVALMAAVVILVQARGAGAIKLDAAPRWVGGGLFVLVGALAALGLAANHALSDGGSALAANNPRAALSDASTAKTFAPWSDQPYILAGQAQLRLKNHPAALASFQHAVSHDSSDWAAWENLAKASTGNAHTRAMARLLALDPRYDIVNGRP